MIADGEASQFAAMIANQKSGVKLMTWPKETIEKFRAAWKEVLADEIKANPDVKKIWASYSAFHEKYKIWGERGYLK
jgi:TRAP-type mannitol/chloroaromatic compound transport system substrate-binding protein